MLYFKFSAVPHSFLMHTRALAKQKWFSLLLPEATSGSCFWKLLKTIPFAELVFQSYSFQTYLWLCSSAKWLPEREKSWDLYISASIQLQRRKSFTLNSKGGILACHNVKQIKIFYPRRFEQRPLVAQRMSWQQASSHASFVHIYQQKSLQSKYILSTMYVLPCEWMSGRANLEVGIVTWQAPFSLHYPRGLTCAEFPTVGGHCSHTLCKSMAIF